MNITKKVATNIMLIEVTLWVITLSLAIAKLLNLIEVSWFTVLLPSVIDLTAYIVFAGGVCLGLVTMKPETSKEEEN